LTLLGDVLLDVLNKHSKLDCLHEVHEEPIYPKWVLCLMLFFSVPADILNKGAVYTPYHISNTSFAFRKGFAAILLLVFIRYPN